jgi:branched-chain amino acid transport system ATP-binding protein
MAEAALLQLDGVNTHIGAYHILHGVELAVHPGRVTALLGRNGAGKTTTLRTIMGLWRASKGAIRFDGADITQAPTSRIARAGIAYVPEDMGIFSLLTVTENLRLAARADSFDPARLQWLYDLFPALYEFRDTPAGALSGGQKQMLAIARALIEPRQLILIDEPTKGLAPAIVDELLQALVELKQRQTPLLLVEQNFQFASTLADDCAVLDDGRTVFTGTMEELTNNRALQGQLLGLGAAANQQTTESHVI